MAARYVNDIDIAKSQRDFELKKAAYDQEVRTKTAQSDLAYALQVTSFYIDSEPYSTSNILCRVYLLSVANCYAETSFTVFVGHVCRSRFQRNQRSSAADISKTGCQKRTKFGTFVVWSLLHIRAETGGFWP